MMLIIFIVVLIAILFWHHKLMVEILGTALLTGILAIGSGVVPALLLDALEAEYPPIVTPHFGLDNAIVLLGAGEVKPPFANQVLPSWIAYSRIFEAARLYSLCKKAQQNCIIYITGGDTIAASMAQAQVYKKALLDVGVNPKDMVLETKSMNTYENAKFTTPFLRKKHDVKIFLVTSAIHLKRAFLYFTHFEIAAIPAAADVITPHFSYIPLSYNFAITDFALHEYVGIARYYVDQGLSLTQPQAAVKERSNEQQSSGSRD